MYFIALYPLVATIVCIKKPLKSELLHWCIWWAMYTTIRMFNTLAWWMPLLDTLETMILFLMYSDIVSNYVRKNVIIYGIKHCNKKVPSLRNVYIRSEKLIKGALITLLTQTSTHNTVVDR